MSRRGKRVPDVGDDAHQSAPQRQRQNPDDGPAPGPQPDPPRCSSTRVRALNQPYSLDANDRLVQYGVEPAHHEYDPTKDPSIPVAGGLQLDDLPENLRDDLMPAIYSKVSLTDLLKSLHLLSKRYLEFRNKELAKRTELTLIIGDGALEKVSNMVRYTAFSAELTHTDVRGKLHRNDIAPLKYSNLEISDYRLLSEESIAKLRELLPRITSLKIVQVGFY